MKHKNPYSPVLVSLLTKRFRAPRLSATIAVFLLLVMVFQPLAAVLAYEESGQIQAVDASMSTSANLDSRSELGMTQTDVIDAIQASPSVILDNIAGVREEVFGDSLAEADVILDPVTDIAEPEATGTDDTDIAGDGETEEEVPEAGPLGLDPIPEVASPPESYYEQNTHLSEVDNKTGALLYGYDFTLPPFRDMNPSLSLGYNSQSEVLSGYVGYGWELSIPYIKRINRTGVDKIYSDNYYYSSLHGELAPIAVDASGYGTYGARVEQGAYALYIRNADGSWTVKLSEGTIVTFGATSSSRQDNPADASKVFRWMVSSRVDTNANTINYTYTKSGGQIYPATIEYSEADIVFSYTPYTDSIKDYSTGFLVENNQNLTGIDVNWNGTLEKEYDLVYMQQEYSARYLLESVIDKSGDEDLTTEFGYTESTDTYFEEDVSLNLQLFEGTEYEEELYNDVRQGFTSTLTFSRVVDINNDGIQDIVCASYDAYDYCDVMYSGDGTIMLGTGDGYTLEHDWVLPVAYVNPPYNVEVHIAEFTGTDSAQDFSFVDFNGDGYVDIKYENKVYINNEINTWVLDPVYGLFSDTGDFYDEDLFEDVRDGFTATFPYSRIVEINGDGLPDIICAVFDKSYTECEVKYSNEGIILLGTENGYTNDHSWSLPTVSMDGTYEIETYIWSNESDDIQDFGFADFNGDGLSDLRYENKVYINNGVDGWILNPKYGLGADTGGEYDEGEYGDMAEGFTRDVTYSRIADLNNDGLADLICAVYDDTSNCEVKYGSDGKLFVNTGDGYTISSDWELPTSSMDGTYEIEVYIASYASSPYRSKDFIMTDFDGNGFLDIKSDNRVFLNKGNQKEKLNLVTSNSGLETSVQYNKLYTLSEETDQVVNNLAIFKPIVVGSVTVSDPLTTSTKSYFYEGADAYIEAPYYKKFAGFSVVTETDSEGNVTKNYYHQGNETDTALGEHEDNFAKIGQVYRTEKYDADGDLYETTINKWESTNLGIDRDFVKLALSASLTYDSDVDHRDRASEYTYDDTTGNILTEVNYGEVAASSIDGSFTDVGTDTKNTTYTYAEDVTGIIQLPAQVTITDNAGTKLREEKYFYDNQPYGVATKGDMTKKNTWKVGATYASETYTYNTFGNITKYKDPLLNQTTYTYDVYNLLPIKVTNPLSQVVQYTYDYSSGKPLTVKDANGFTSTYIYDGLDRVIEEKVPNPTTGASVTKTTYVYDDVSFPRSVHKSVICDATIAKEVYTYIDGFGRAIQTREELETPDMFAVVDTVYDTRGNIATTSLPYEASGEAYDDATTDEDMLTGFVYDPMNRIVSIDNILGTTTYSYDDWKKTVVDANAHQKEFYENAYGNLVQVTEKNGFFTYNTYYAWNVIGELTKITDALGNVRNFTYNGFGNRVTAEDLHAPADATFGIWTYTYDNEGNMTKSVSPNAHTVNYTYDVLNRVLSENWTGGAGVEVAYTYDTCINGKGKLCTAVRGGVTSSYTYTPTGQIKDESTTIDAVVYTTTTSYNYCGSPIEIVHPNGTKTRYLFDTTGAVNGIQRKETTGGYQNIVSVVDYTEFGKPETVSFANGVVTTYTYADMQRLADIDTVKDVNVIQDLHYDYDPVGNIIAITDASGTATTKTAMYTYDSLDRLTLAEVYGTPEGEDYVESFAYNAIGNLTTKGDSGTYLYQGNTGTNYANPHAATKVGVTTFTYDTNGNLTNDGTNTYTWNYRNEQASATTPAGATSYVYNHDGARMKYVSPTATIITPSSTYEKEGAILRRHIYLGDMLVGTVETGVATPDTRYAHTDHLGSVEKMTDATGAILETNDYFPYGEMRVHDGDTGGDRAYLGKYHDDATGLEYLEARYYSSARGQFVSQDPAFWSLAHADKQLVDPQSWNSYAYARNNPLVMKDPEGEFAIEAMLLMTFAGDIIRSVLEKQQKAESTQNETPSLPTPESSAPVNLPAQTSQTYQSELGNSRNLLGGEYLDGGIVEVTFNTTSNNKVNSKLVQYFKTLMDKASLNGIKSVNISSTTDHTSNPGISNHEIQNGASALDISIINNIAVSGTNLFAQTLQNLILETSGYRENFGPFMNKKALSAGATPEDKSSSGSIVAGHKNHVHISVQK
jgi:RHS repeat-associated protein